MTSMWTDTLGDEYAQDTLFESDLFESDLSDLSDCDFEEIIETSLIHNDTVLAPVHEQPTPDQPPTPDPSVNAVETAEQVPAPPKRKYDRQKSRQSRARNRLLRKEGIKPPPPYQPKDATLILDGNRLVYCKKRKYEATGRYVGANVKKGGTTRQFKKHPLKYMQQSSKFFESSVIPTKKRCQKRAGVQAYCAQTLTTNEDALSVPGARPADVP